MSPTPDFGYHQSRILIVDDDRRNRELLDVMLTPEGFLLRHAGSGEEALALLAREPPDLVLLDIMMPGMDGYQVAATMKGNPATRNIPIIMVTALDDRQAKILGLTAGAEEFLTKPVDRAELCVRVKNLLRLKAYGDYYDQYSQMLEGEVASRTADLAERTRQAAVLAEQAALLDLAPDAIVVCDMQGRILFWSHGAEGLYGWQSQEALGRNLHDLLNTQIPQSMEQLDATLLREGRWEGEAIHHARTGAPVNVATRWALQRDVAGAPVRILTITNNITDRKRADAERLLLTERLSLATAVARVGVWEWDLASGMLTWDATMCEIYGCPSVVPMPYETWSKAVYPADLSAVEGALQRAIDDKSQGAVEYRIVQPDGSVRHVSAVAKVVLDAHGSVSRMIGVDMDITERTAAEEAAEQIRSDQMRFKDEFLSHVSHELRSPLTAIKQFTTILLGGVAGELNTEQREYQQIVLKNIRQLQSMIDDLLEVTRLETGKLTIDLDSVSVRDAVTDTFHTLQVTAAAKRVTLSHDLPRDLPSAHADPTRLRQILIILFDNAIKFTPQGGTAHIRAQLLEDDPRFLLLEVSDTGCGISPEMTERLFERLYQESAPIHASRKGLGLGLYICKELVTRQGGQVWAAPRRPQGSTLSFTVPVFSIDNVIAPLLTNNTWPAESVALVLVKAHLPNAWTSKDAQHEWRRDVRGVIQRCVLPNKDVVLPAMGCGAESECFWVAAFADEQGASVLANRIREQLGHFPRLTPGGLTLSVSLSMLQPLSRPPGARRDGMVATMAARLEESVKSHSVFQVVSR